MTFSSQLGVGSTFSVFLPMIVTKKPGQSARNPQEDTSFSGQQILLVEDDRVNQIVVTKMLKSMGAVVDVAGNGVAGIDAVSKKKYDLILMDIQMPKMDGLEATRIIRGGQQNNPSDENLYRPENQLNRKTPIIALTAFALKGDEASFKASGMDGYLSKPVDRIQMQSLLKKYLDTKQQSKDQSVPLVTSSFDVQMRLMQEDALMEPPKSTVQEREAVTQRIDQLHQLLDQKNLELMEVIAHQLKGIFERMNADELKNLVFKMELEIRKSRIGTVSEYLEQIAAIWFEMNAGAAGEN
ncbi:response regulator [Acetobacterium wieringae]|uniref:response regulator n=1 Tax=Acetobacterium wieringae TaxID=52694 RepID=UPI0026F26D8B|nr:response regulator [Acetobacterium wieringae]